MDEQRKQELASIISTLEARFKHYDEVAERHDQNQMARAFNSAVVDFEYALQTLRAVHDDRSFDQEEE